jgi:hypothetical protein
VLDLADPIFLTASTPLPSNSQGGVNAQALKNPLGTPMEIMEIRWQVFGSVGSGVLPATLIPIGGAIGCKLVLGNIELTNGFIPLWLFGRCDNVFADDSKINGVLGVFNTNYYCEMVWRLPQPLFVPAGAVLQPTFQHYGYGALPMTVTISYCARSLKANASPPALMPVPWVSKYISKSMDYAFVDNDTSQETDIINPYDVPVHLQRMTGRVVTQMYDTLGLITRFTDSDALNTNVIAPGFDEPNITVRIVDSAGNPIVRNATRIRQVFHNTTRSWEMSAGTTMPPNSFYNVVLAQVAGAAGALIVTQRQVHIAAVGWREYKRGAA